MYNDLPRWLTFDCPQYILDMSEEKKQQKLEENPYAIIGNRFCVHRNKQPLAHTDDINTFTTLKQACSKANRTKDAGVGIGLFGPYCGIDIDHCIDNNGVISDTALEIMALFQGAYMETSISGTGIHIIFMSKSQRDYSDEYYTKMSEQNCIKNGYPDIGGLEFYQGTIDNRYFTLSGNLITQPLDDHIKSQDTIERFLDTYMTKAVVTIPSTPVTYTEDDEEDEAWFKFAKNFIYKEPKFLAFFPGVKSLFDSYNFDDHTGDESRQDLILMSKLAFWCNNNPCVMQAAFEDSTWFDTKVEGVKGKGKDKWNSRPDYRNDYCIQPAIRGTHNVAKACFKDWFYYDFKTKQMNIDGFRQAHKGGGETVMVYPVEGKPGFYTYKDENGIRYHAFITQSKAGKNYVKHLNAFDCNTRQKLGDIEPKNADGTWNKEFFNISEHFLKNIK